MNDIFDPRDEYPELLIYLLQIDRQESLWVMRECLRGFASKVDAIREDVKKDIVSESKSGTATDQEVDEMAESYLGTNVVFGIWCVQFARMWTEILEGDSVLAREWSELDGAAPADLPDNFLNRLLGYKKLGHGERVEVVFTPEEFVRAYLEAGYDLHGLAPTWRYWAVANVPRLKLLGFVGDFEEYGIPDESAKAPAPVAGTKGKKKSGGAPKFAGLSCSDIHVIVRVGCLSVKRVGVRGMGEEYEWKELSVKVGDSKHETLMLVAKSTRKDNVEFNKRRLNDTTISRFNKRFREKTGVSDNLLSRELRMIRSNAGKMTWSVEERKTPPEERSNQQERIDRTGRGEKGLVEDKGAPEGQDRSEDDESPDGDIPEYDYEPSWRR